MEAKVPKNIKIEKRIRQKQVTNLYPMPNTYVFLLLVNNSIKFFWLLGNWPAGWV